MGSLVASQFRVSMPDAVSGLPGEGDALPRRRAADGAARRRRTRRRRSRTRAKVSFVDAFTSTLWVGAVVVVVASGIVAWLLRPKATAKADAMVAAEAGASSRAEAA